MAKPVKHLWALRSRLTKRWHGHEGMPIFFRTKKRANTYRNVRVDEVREWVPKKWVPATGASDE